MRLIHWAGALLVFSVVLSGCLAPGGEVRLNSAKARQQEPASQPSPDLPVEVPGVDDPPVAPAVPANVRVTGVTSVSVSLGWDPSAGAAQYRIYRGGVNVGQVTSPSFSDAGLVANTRHDYEVEAVGANGLVSYRSAPVAGTTAAASGRADPSMVDVSLNPANGGEAPAVGVQSSTAINFTLQVRDSHSGLRGARFFRYVAKGLSASQRASVACQALSTQDQTQRDAPVDLQLCTGGGSELQEVFYVGVEIPFSEAQRVPGVSVTFSQGVSASSLGRGTHRVAVWISDQLGNTSMVTRVVTVQ